MMYMDRYIPNHLRHTGVVSEVPTYVPTQGRTTGSIQEKKECIAAEKAMGLEIATYMGG